MGHNLHRVPAAGRRYLSIADLEQSAAQIVCLEGIEEQLDQCLVEAHRERRGRNILGSASQKSKHITRLGDGSSLYLRTCSCGGTLGSCELVFSFRSSLSWAVNRVRDSSTLSPILRWRRSVARDGKARPVLCPRENGVGDLRLLQFFAGARCIESS